jgi:hypothetical protein
MLATIRVHRTMESVVFCGKFFVVDDRSFKAFDGDRQLLVGNDSPRFCRGKGKMANKR